MIKVRMRFPGRTLGAMLLGLTLVVATAGMSGADSTAQGGNKGALTMGSKNLPGAQVLGQVYGQALQKNGYSMSYKENLGSTEVVFAALESGDLDLYPDYLNTVVQFLGGNGGSDVTQVKAELDSLLQSRGIVATKPAPAVDVNGFYVQKKTATKYKLKTVSDLKRVANKLTFGAPPECEQRPLCLGDTEQQKYGLQFKEVKKLDTGGPVTVKALEDGNIQVAVLFTGSSVIPKDAVLLKDDQGLQGADNPLVLVRQDKYTPELGAAIDKVSAKITTKQYRTMTLGVQNQKKDPADVAKQFLKDNKLN
ncbi:MAG: ABC transporter substrate-binding protein [Actinomycetota bacterium]|nr:ABC transporter substrate-binding protein [Actinomycetota bacterium]